MARPEGYRKAARLMELADKFDLPVISLVDTAGAWPGVDAEERGQAEAIARATDASLSLGSPNVAVIVGEGGSGGALAIAVADRVLMLENAIYTVASPETCASIMWRDAAKRADAAAALKMTASEVKELGCIDDVVAEPDGGAQNDPIAAAALLDETLVRHYNELKHLPFDKLVAARQAKFRNLGQFYTV
jgi:acetyl-CoA carboxylase carboxyl transferase subunit alpha